MKPVKLVPMALLLLSGCALLLKSDPVVPRYFTPESSHMGQAGVVASPTGLSVRLGHVGSGSYLKERMAYRSDDYEFGFREDRRWSERPEAYLQRALERSLFEERGITRALSGPVPTLSAELIEFEEVIGSPPHVRLRISYALHDDKQILREGTFAIERVLPDGPEATHPDRVAAGLGVALREAVARISDETVAELSAQRARSVGR